jgi:hypothetical protein
VSDTFSGWQQEATKEREEVWVCFDRRLLSELEQAESDLKKHEAAKKQTFLDEPSASQDAGSRVEKLRKKIEESRRMLVFENIGRGPWRELLRQHPPTPEQREQMGRDLDNNPDTFPVVALSASCVEPGLTKDQAEWLMNELPIAEFERVWAACIKANILGARDPFVSTGNLLRGVKR